LLALAFTEDVRDGDEYRYKQSIAINELLFDNSFSIIPFWDGPQFDRAAGTVYPSLQMRGEVDNAVIFPEFVDRALKLQAVQVVSVEAADEKAFSYSVRLCHQSRAVDHGRILWIDPLPPEMAIRMHFALEHGRWLAKDDDGNSYEFRGLDDPR
jgi:hypothetical protein